MVRNRERWEFKPPKVAFAWICHWLGSPDLTVGRRRNIDLEKGPTAPANGGQIWTEKNKTSWLNQWQNSEGCSCYLLSQLREGCVGNRSRCCMQVVLNCWRSKWGDVGTCDGAALQLCAAGVLGNQLSECPPHSQWFSAVCAHLYTYSTGPWARGGWGSGWWRRERHYKSGSAQSHPQGTNEGTEEI